MASKYSTESSVANVQPRRTGEKLGWLGGWTGGFLWLLVFVILRFAQGYFIQAFIALGIFALAMTFVFVFAPWRWPSTRYYLLMPPPFAVFLGAVCWVVWSLGGLKENGLAWWHFLWIIACMSPFVTVGARRWKDGDARLP